MLDFGVHERWPAKAVEKKWQQLHPEDETNATKGLGTLQQVPIRAPARDPGGGDDFQPPDSTSSVTLPNGSQESFSQSPGIVYSTRMSSSTVPSRGTQR